MTSITPQLIKDQEFEVKFRGFDPIEVRDYLETIADTFFELQQQCKEQAEEVETLREAHETTEQHKNSLETDIEFTRKMSDELKDGCAQKEETIRELTAEIEELKLVIADMEQEDTEFDEEISAGQASIEEAEKALKDSEAEKSRLQSKVDVLQEQNKELKKEEVEFKSTLAAAQRFAEDLKEKSREEAEEMIAVAKAEIEKIRDDAHDELQRLPREIAALKKTKGQVKTDLKATLESYMETIDVFYPDEDEESVEDDDDELFQKIQLNEDGSINPEDAEKIGESEKKTDENVLESLLGGDSDEEGEGDELKLERMFSLETDEEGKKESS